MTGNSVFYDLEQFFDSVPDVVRAELSLLLLALADDEFADTEEFAEPDLRVRRLFRDQGGVSRFGTLIYALGAFDVYFAADPNDRLGQIVERLQTSSGGMGRSHPLRRRYADHLAAIDKARGDWHLLRNST